MDSGMLKMLASDSERAEFTKIINSARGRYEANLQANIITEDTHKEFLALLDEFESNFEKFEPPLTNLQRMAGFKREKELDDEVEKYHNMWPVKETDNKYLKHQRLAAVHNIVSVQVFNEVLKAVLDA